MSNECAEPLQGLNIIGPSGGDVISRRAFQVQTNRHCAGQRPSDKAPSLASA